MLLQTTFLLLVLGAVAQEVSDLTCKSLACGEVGYVEASFAVNVAGSRTRCAGHWGFSSSAANADWLQCDNPNINFRLSSSSTQLSCNNLSLSFHDAHTGRSLGSGSATRAPEARGAGYICTQSIAVLENPMPGCVEPDFDTRYCEVCTERTCRSIGEDGFVRVDEQPATIADEL